MRSSLPDDAFMSEIERKARDEAFAGSVGAFRQAEGRRRAAAAQARARAAEARMREKQNLPQPSWKLEMEAELEAVRPASHARPHRVGPNLASQRSGDDAIADVADEDSDDDEDVAHVVVSGTPAVFETTPAVVPPEVAELKDVGARAVRDGKWQAAIDAYSEALVPETTGEPRAGLPPEYAAALHNNRSLARLKLGDAQGAEGDASAAHALWPEWPKPLHRLASARLALKKFAGAMSALRRGQQLARSALHEHMARDFGPLLERISYEGVIAGSYDAFDGRTLEVRDAGEDAWKMGPAPHVPALDNPQAETSINALEDGVTDARDRVRGGTDLAVLGGSDGSTLASRSANAIARAHAAKQRYSYRSIHEAMDAAEDGDRILLKAGIHNTGGTMVTVKKRVLIRGEGTLGNAKLDQRGNSPTFRCMGHFVVQNLHITHTGYRETLMCESGRPIFENCVLKNDSDDAVNVIGTGNPTFRHCYVGEAKKAAFVFYENARGLITDCMIRDNQQHGVRVTGKACPTIRRCSVINNGEDGVAFTEDARGSLSECNIRANLGTGVDVSRQAKPLVEESVVKNNKGGGVFFWDDARGTVRGCRVDGGESHALIVDGDSAPRMEQCTFDGVCLVPQEVLDKRCKANYFNQTDDASRWIPPEKAYEPIGASVLKRGIDNSYY